MDEFKIIDQVSAGSERLHVVPDESFVDDITAAFSLLISYLSLSGEGGHVLCLEGFQ